MDLGLAGKVFVVTAASGGLGRATADQLDFDEKTFPADPLSDHCAVTTRLRLR